MLEFIEFINRADAAIHGLCTKFSHRLQRATGLTCYFVARVGVGLTALNVLAEIINYYFPFLPDRTTIAMAVISALILISCVPRSIACQRGDDSVWKNTKPVELIFYTTGAFWRMVWVALALLNLPFVFIHSSHLGAALLQDETFPLGCALFYNFINVTPLPPGTSKVREWIRGLLAAPAEMAKQENA